MVSVYSYSCRPRVVPIAVETDVATAAFIWHYIVQNIPN